MNAQQQQNGSEPTVNGSTSGSPVTTELAERVGFLFQEWAEESDSDCDCGCEYTYQPCIRKWQSESHPVEEAVSGDVFMGCEQPPREEWDIEGSLPSICSLDDMEVEPPPLMIGDEEALEKAFTDGEIAEALAYYPPMSPHPGPEQPTSLDVQERVQEIKKKVEEIAKVPVTNGEDWKGPKHPHVRPKKSGKRQLPFYQYERVAHGMTEERKRHYIEEGISNEINQEVWYHIEQTAEDPEFSMAHVYTPKMRQTRPDKIHIDDALQCHFKVVKIGDSFGKIKAHRQVFRNQKWNIPATTRTEDIPNFLTAELQRRKSKSFHGMGMLETVHFMLVAWVKEMETEPNPRNAYARMLNQFAYIDRGFVFANEKGKLLNPLGVCAFYSLIYKHGIQEQPYTTLMKLRPVPQEHDKVRVLAMDWDTLMRTPPMIMDFKHVEPAVDRYLQYLYCFHNILDCISLTWGAKAGSVHPEHFSNAYIIAMTYKHYVLPHHDNRPIVQQTCNDQCENPFCKDENCNGDSKTDFSENLMNMFEQSKTYMSDTAKSMVPDEITSVLSSMKKQFGEVGNVVNALQGKVMEVVKPLLDIFGISDTNDLKSCSYQALELVKYYIIFINTASVALKGVAIFGMLNVLNISSLVFEKVTAFMQMDLELNDSETPKEEKVQETSLFSGALDFLVDLFGSLECLTTKGGATLLALMLFILCGVALKGPELKGYATAFVSQMKNMHFVGAGILAFSKIISVFTSALKWVFDYIGKKVYNKIPEDQQKAKELDEHTTEVTAWCARVTVYGEDSFIQTIRTYQNMGKVIQEEYMKMFDYEKRNKEFKLTPDFLRMFNDAKRSIQKAHNAVVRVMGTAMFRQTPYHLQFDGAPGVGKSRLMRFIVNTFSEKFFPGREQTIYSKSDTDHFDGYVGQDIVVIDDMFPINNPESAAMWLPLISNVPIIVPMAHLEDKGQYFTSKFIVSTTNTPYPMIDDVFCMEALYRRRHMLVHVTMDEKVKDKNTGKFSPALFEKHYPKQSSDAYPHLKFSLRSPTQRDVYMQDCNDVKGLSKPLTDLPLAEFLQRVETHYKEHMISEDIFRQNENAKLKYMFDVLTCIDNVHGTVQSPLLDKIYEMNFGQAEGCTPTKPQENQPEPGQEYEDEQKFEMDSFIPPWVTKVLQERVLPSAQEKQEKFCYFSGVMACAYGKEAVTKFTLQKGWTISLNGLPIDITPAWIDTRFKVYKELFEQIREKEEHKQRMWITYYQMVGISCFRNNAEDKAYVEANFPKVLTSLDDVPENVDHKWWVEGEMTAHSEILQSTPKEEVPILISRLGLQIELITSTIDDLVGRPFQSMEHIVMAWGEYKSGAIIADPFISVLRRALDEEIDEELVAVLKNMIQYLKRIVWCQELLVLARDDGRRAKRGKRNAEADKPVDYPLSRFTGEDGLTYLRMSPTMKIMIKTTYNGHTAWNEAKGNARYGGKTFDVVFPQKFWDDLGCDEVLFTSQFLHAITHVKRRRGKIWAFKNQDKWHIDIKGKVSGQQIIWNSDYMQRMGVTSWFMDNVQKWFALTEDQRVAIHQQYLRHHYIFTFAQSFAVKTTRKITEWCKKIKDGFSGAVSYVWNKLGAFKRPVMIGLVTAAIIGACKMFATLFVPKAQETSVSSNRLFGKPSALSRAVLTSGNVVPQKVERAVTQVLVGGKECQGFKLCPKVIMIPTHILQNMMNTRTYSFSYRMTSNTFMTTNIPKENFVSIPNSDVTLVHSPDFPQFGDCLSYFYEKEDIEREKQFVTDEVLVPVLAKDGFTNFIAPFSKFEMATNSFMNGYKLTDARVGCYKTTMPVGTSGSPVISLSTRRQNGRCIMGIQSFTSNGSSYFSFVSQGSLKHYCDQITQKYPKMSPPPAYVIPQEEVVQQTCMEKYDMMDENLILIGQVPKEFIVRTPPHTSLKLTPWMKGTKQSRIPPILSPNDLRACGHPMKDSLTKYGRNPMKTMNDHFLASAISDYVADMYWDTRDLRVLSTKEAIEGVNGQAHINLRSSPGIPWVYEKQGVPGKKNFIEIDENGKLTYLNPKLDKSIRECEQQLKQGYMPECILAEFPKDELRPVGKVLGLTEEEVTEYYMAGRPVSEWPKDRVCKTRSIDACPLQFVVIYRKYFSHLETIFMKKADGTHEYAVGINVESVSTLNAFMQAAAINNKGYDFDVGKWDSNFSPQLARAVTQMVNELYDDGQDNMLLRSTFIEGMLFAYLQYDDTVYQKQWGIPSGFPGTTFYNTIGHMILALYIWKNHCKNKPDMLSLAVKRHKTKDMFYGDDRILIVSAEIEDWYNGETVAAHYKALGWPITSAQKVGQIQAVPLSEVTFLKRKWKPCPEVQQMVFWALDPESIESLFCYYRQNDEHPKIQIYQNLCVALEYAAPHGKTFYNDFISRVNKALYETSYNCIVSSYHDQVFKLFKRYFGLTERSSSVILDLPEHDMIGD